MPESRDRLTREEDPLTPMLGHGSIGRSFHRLEQERGFQIQSSPSRFSNGGGRNLFGSPLQLRPMAMLPSWSPAMGPMAMTPSRGGLMGRVGYGTPRNLYGNLSIGQENIRTRGSIGSGRRGRRRVRNSPLPNWYPRNPLRDITGVVNAIERRRTRLREAERDQSASTSQQELSVTDPNPPIPGAPLDHDISLASPNPTTAIKHCPPPVQHLSKILLGNNAAGESDFLTPQKKLLNSIDQVEKVVMEDFRRLKRTPTAKKAEREKKVRTLMAMR